MTLLLLGTSIPPPINSNLLEWLAYQERKRIEEDTATLMAYFLFEDYQVEQIHSDN